MKQYRKVSGKKLSQVFRFKLGFLGLCHPDVKTLSTLQPRGTVLLWRPTRHHRLNASNRPIHVTLMVPARWHQ